MQPISFILCNYNAADYFQFSYESLRRNLWAGHEIVLLDDGSTDGSQEWMRSLGSDPNVVRVENPENIGIAYSYNRAVEQASNELICVLHTDMYVPPGFDQAMIRGIEGRDFIAALRVEPLVYPPSPDKVNLDFGLGLDTFDEPGFLAWSKDNSRMHQGETFETLFFPWMTKRSFFTHLGGVDLLFLKYMVDDDDLYLRAKLAGGRCAQVRDAAVYHFGSRSTRFAADVDSDEPPASWLAQYRRSQRNFVRKWGRLSARCWGKEMELIPPAKYDIGLMVPGINLEQLDALEPFCTNIYLDDAAMRQTYLKTQQGETMLCLAERVRLIDRGEPGNRVVAGLNMALLNERTIALAQNLPATLDKFTGPGRVDMEERIFLNVRSLAKVERDLVVNTRRFAYAPGVEEREFLSPGC